MDFQQARVAMEILGRYTCGQNRDWGDEENRKRPIEEQFSFSHDQGWITLYRIAGTPELTDDERRRMDNAGWFWDEAEEAWSHF